MREEYDFSKGKKNPYTKQLKKQVTITSKSGNVVMISESDYNALMETVYLMSNPSFMEGYKEAKEQDRSTYEKLDLEEGW